MTQPLWSSDRGKLGHSVTTLKLAVTSYVWYKEDAAQAPGAGSKKSQVEEYDSADI